MRLNSFRKGSSAPRKEGGIPETAVKYVGYSRITSTDTEGLYYPLGPGGW